MPAAQRPNIVFFIADDHGWADSGCYGNPVVRTPNIDRLAREGMRFTRAFTASPQCAPSRTVICTGLYPHRSGAHPNHSPVRAGIRTLPAYFADLGYRVVLEGKTHLTPREAFPFEGTWDGRHFSLERMDALLADPGDKPLFLWVASHQPHKPWPEVATFSPADVIVPPWIEDTPEMRAGLARYYTAVEKLDREVAQVLGLLDARGMTENTLFVYASDHGIQVPHSKWELYDPGIRLPFIVRWPGRVAPGSTADAMVSYVDVLPTWMEAAGAPAPEGIDGRSFLGVLEGRADAHRDWIFATHTVDVGPMTGRHYSNFPMRCLRTHTHKYILNLTAKNGGLNRGTRAARQVNGEWTWPREEFYDLRVDPHELRNAADDPAQKATLDAMRAQLREICLAQGDPMPEGLAPVPPRPERP